MGVNGIQIYHSFQIPKCLFFGCIYRILPVSILTVILSFLNLSTIFGSDKTGIEFEALTVRDGLSQNTVECILQDHLGYMWFGTHDGLNRYDGYEVQTYYSDPVDEKSLSHNLITVIFEDREKNLWIGTIAGLDKFNRTENSFDRIASLAVTSI
ncbi:MAG: hypothetical protein GWN00_38610, partial [Aliifodinibius sp.]|nr:hypothetical protein [Fodinibius sp.]NIV16533.1 hypothetical protein [Fodinibius sp.]NIY30484.1 hypothetical protein [Fodinibius sp.]